MGVTARVSEDELGTRAKRDSKFPAVSDDGRYVAFASTGDNLVAVDSNVASDIFVRDRQTGSITRVSVDSLGGEGNSNSFSPSISSDGRYVVFSSDASNLVPDDTNNFTDTFVHDRMTGQTTRVSVSSTGGEGDTASGSLLGWHSDISADGRFVVFSSNATNLVSDDTNFSSDIFVRDRETGNTTRISVDSGGNQSDGASYFPVISADGRFIAFSSDGTNLVVGDQNVFSDVFIHDRNTGVTKRISVDSSGAEGNGPSGAIGPLTMSADGQLVAFESQATKSRDFRNNITFECFSP